MFFVPIAYPVIKAHKAWKHYPAKDVISHQGYFQESLASYLVPLINLLIKEEKPFCTNSEAFVLFLDHFFSL